MPFKFWLILSKFKEMKYHQIKKSFTGRAPDASRLLALKRYPLGTTQWVVPSGYWVEPISAFFRFIWDGGWLGYFETRNQPEILINLSEADFIFWKYIRRCSVDISTKHIKNPFLWKLLFLGIKLFRLWQPSWKAFLM